MRLLVLALMAAFVLLVAPAFGQEPSCGNGACESGEDSNSCPADCGSPSSGGGGGGFCGNGACESGEDSNSCPADCGSSGGGAGGGGSSCGNGACESGEDPVSCPADCGSSGGGGASGPLCGNGVCEPGEDGNSCTPDCGSSGGGGGAFCGNGACEAGEDPGSCPADCGSSGGGGGAFCGNNFCEPGEDPGSCPADCGPSGGGGGGFCGDGVCGEGEKDACLQDCGGAPRGGAGSCPASLSCPDGSTVACEQGPDFCRCPCPPPPGCQEQRDERGFTHVVCESSQQQCPAIPKDAVDRCREAGGEPRYRDGPGGCQFMECDYHQEGKANPFEGRRCPGPEELQDIADRCAASGFNPRSTFEAGCRMMRCGGENEGPRCEENFEGRRASEAACREQGLQPQISFNEEGCKSVTCGQSACVRSVPQSAYRACEARGGEFVVQNGKDGCIRFSDCVRRGKADDVEVEEVREVPDTAELLTAAFKLEELIQKLDALSRQSDALAEYYASTGSADEKRFRRVASMFSAAKDEVNAIKDRLRQDIDDLTVRDIEEFKDGLRHLKEVTLKDILYVMLSTSEDAERRFESEESVETDDFFAFDQAFRVCEAASFRPDKGVEIRLEGIDGDGACTLKAASLEGSGFGMECHIKDFASGMNVGPDGPTPETMDRWACTGPMADMIRSGETGGPGGCKGDDECDRFCRENPEECFRWCQDHPGICPGGGPPAPGERTEFQQREFEEFNEFDRPPREFDRPEFESREFEGGEFERPEFVPGGEPAPAGPACSGCFDNGVCDPGECPECGDCGRGFR